VRTSRGLGGIGSGELVEQPVAGGASLNFSRRPILEKCHFLPEALLVLADSLLTHFGGIDGIRRAVVEVESGSLSRRSRSR
jgi:hypothetical protein